MNDSTSLFNTTDDDDDSIASSTMPTLLPTFKPLISVFVVHWIIFTVGVTGNLVVLWASLWRPSSSQKVTQLFIESLAFNNLVMLSVKFTEAFGSVDANYRFSEVTCKITTAVHACAINVSSWTHAMLALDR